MRKPTSTRIINGRETCNVSTFHSRQITGESIVNGRLVVEFREFNDELIGHPAGRIVCEPVEDNTPNLASDDGHTPEWYNQISREDAENGDIRDWLMDATVSRLGGFFWDRGVVDFVT